jgi:hypothetical protein
MICRLWRGWATTQNADAYERIVREQVALLRDHDSDQDSPELMGRGETGRDGPVSLAEASVGVYDGLGRRSACS